MLGNLESKKRLDVYDFISPTSGTKNAAVRKSVLITRAGFGIRKHTAIHFARAGASFIVLVGRTANDLESSNAKVLVEAPDCRAVCAPTDISDPAAVSALFEKTGKIDILINNAGTTGIIGPLTSVDLNKWWMAYEVNIRGTYLMASEFFKLLAGGPGVVLNISSRSSYVTAPGMSAYQISKSTLHRLTEFIDKEHGSQGVVAVAFHLGGVPGTKVAHAAPEWLPALPASTALYLMLPRAKYLSGRFINAQWDIEKLETHRERIISEDLPKMRVLGIDDQL
ncbi:NAD(P)-binding protein [Xylariaceae sp. FL0255]|nr:NAD(P)-binding protein [Xylariaceae sp. FL0255]